MTPLVLTLAGVAAIAVALLLLRTLGPRARLGRLLAAAPGVSIEEAQELAAGPAVYVRVTGRVSSDEEFPDENDRPLVFRRTRIQVKSPGAQWRELMDEREAVPFGVETRSTFLAVDETALGDGLVAIPRVADGVVGQIPPERTDLLEAAAGLPADTPMRLTIEQVSAVEHVTACGRPMLRDGQPFLTAGLGRPLIVTSLDQPAAMRILAAGARRRVAAAALLIAAGLVLFVIAAGVLVAGLALADPVLAASPAASPLPTPLPTPVPSPASSPGPVLIDPLDPRAGAGASMVGAPLLALLVVVGAGIAVAIATFAYVRLTARRSGTSRSAHRR
jgi:hypothetical protein